MYAVVSSGGKQLKVEKGTEAVVEKLDVPVGDEVTLDALFVTDGKDIVVGSDAMASVKVTAEVIEHFKGEKVTVFKFKRRKGYKRLKGHRQQQTRIRIIGIDMLSVPKKKAAKKAVEEAVKPAEKKAAAPKKPKKAEAKPAKAEKAAPKKAEAKKAESKKAEPKKAESKKAEAKKTEPKKAEKKPKTAAAPQCEAIKANGERCTNKAKEGSKYCGVHAKKYEGK